jgi:hypothetical protein
MSIPILFLTSVFDARGLGLLEFSGITYSSFEDLMWATVVSQGLDFPGKWYYESCSHTPWLSQTC